MAVNNGVIKMNVDTDTQYAYLVGIRVSISLAKSLSHINIQFYFQDFIEKKKGYLQSQVGNPEGEDKPNKKVRYPYLNIFLFSFADHGLQYYDPRVWVREGEKTLVERVKIACSDLGNVSEYPFFSL